MDSKDEDSAGADSLITVDDLARQLGELDTLVAVFGKGSYMLVGEGLLVSLGTLCWSLAGILVIVVKKVARSNICQALRWKQPMLLESIVIYMSGRLVKIFSSYSKKVIPLPLPL